jgi:hypothetical protein
MFIVSSPGLVDSARRAEFDAGRDIERMAFAVTDRGCWVASTNFAVAELPGFVFV